MRLSPICLVGLLMFSKVVFSATGAITLEEQSPSARFVFSGQDHFIFSNAKDPNDPSLQPTQSFMHEMNLGGQYDAYSLNLEYENSYRPNSTEFTHPFSLAKVTGEADWKNWEIKFGDSHQQFGREIALSLYKDDVFGLDTTLQGVSVRYHPDGMDSKVIAGRINTINAPVSINALPNPVVDRNVWLAGTSQKFDLGAETSVGGHYLLAADQPTGSQRYDTIQHTVGAILEKGSIFGGIDAYVESNVLFVKNQVGDTVQSLANGYGSYASFTWSPLPWKLKVEGKDYRNYTFQFQRPPTLEDDLVETPNTPDVSGERVTIEKRLGDNPKNSVYVSELEGYERTRSTDIHHPIIGTKLEGPSRSALEFRTGYRWLPNTEDMAHATLKGKIHTAKGQYLEISFLKQYSHLGLNLIPSREDRNVLGVTYTFNEKLNASLGYEYVPTNDPSVGNNFFNVSGNYIIGALVARVFVGQTSGGTICSGGVCRRIPPYTGVMGETRYTF